MFARVSFILLVSILMLTGMVSAGTIYIPDDYNTIQDGIDSAEDGDTVLVADGIYTGEGNRNIWINEKCITVKSLNGCSSSIIDAELSGHRVFVIKDCDTSGVVIDGFTIAGGIVYEHSLGAGLVCFFSTLTVKNCLFTNNRTYGRLSLVYGGGAALVSSDARFINCTFAKNSSDWGSAIAIEQNTKISIYGTLIAFNGGYDAILCVNHEPDSIYWPVITNCNIFDNRDSLFFCQCNYENVDSIDPLFCDTAAGDFALHANSPCIPENNPSGILIGALGVGCPMTDLSDNTSESFLPQEFELYQSYPNPFNPTTEIEFGISSRSQVLLTVYNILGRKIKTLLDEEKPAGKYIVKWDGTDNDGNNVASGIYFYRLKAGDFVDSKKMLLLK